MKQITSLIVILLIAGAMLSGCIEEPKEQEPPVKTIEDLAVDIVTLLINEDFAGVYGYFNTSITSQITAEDFAMIWQQQIATPNGNITRIVRTREVNESGYTVVYVTCNFSKIAVLDVKISLNVHQRVISLLVVPTLETFAYSPPSYVDLNAFSEQNVSFGLERWKLPATLTIPNGAGPFPAVLLVHGSGPNDRDETYGPNKPFKDLAWGLASRGVVVLRYEKRTFQYPEEIAQLTNFTVQDETIEDAVAGVDFLSASSFVDHGKIVVLGHSLGGMLAPRIALQTDRIAGLILLAAPSRPLEDLMLEQTRYLANLSGVNQSDELEELARLVLKVKTLDMEEGEDVLGAPKSYWADLATYDPVSTVQSLHIPMLILQGKRDYQVTMTDFSRWNETFSENQSVNLKTYSSLNHFFIAGTGVPSSAEYLLEGHVAAEIISDIATWITTQ